MKRSNAAMIGGLAVAGYLGWRWWESHQATAAAAAAAAPQATSPAAAPGPGPAQATMPAAAAVPGTQATSVPPAPPQPPPVTLTPPPTPTTPAFPAWGVIPPIPAGLPTPSNGVVNSTPPETTATYTAASPPPTTINAALPSGWGLITPPGLPADAQVVAEGYNANGYYVRMYQDAAGYVYGTNETDPRFNGQVLVLTAQQVQNALAGLH